MTDQEKLQLERIEKRLNRLVMLSLVQTGVLVGLVAVMLFNQFYSWITTLLFLAIGIGLVVLFRKQIPGWFGSAGRFVVAKMVAGQSHGKSKDELF